MNKVLHTRKYIYVFGIPLVLITTLILLSKSIWFQEFPKELAMAITIDLVLVVPLVYYFLIRKKEIPKITVVTLFVIGLVVASLIIPDNQQEVLSLVKTVAVPIVEVVVLFLVISKTRKIVQSYKAQNRSDIDFFDAVKLAVKEVVPNKLSHLLSTEIAVIYYGLISWRKRRLKENEFSYHQKSTTISVLVGFMIVILIETFTLHHLLQKWNLIVAWIFTFLSVYTCLQFFALLKSVSKRPSFIDEANEQLILRYGIFSEAKIPFKAIKHVQVFEKDISDNKEIITFSPFGKIEGVNMLIELHEESTFNSFYGFTKNYTSLVFFIDEKQQFLQKVDGLLSTEK